MSYPSIEIVCGKCGTSINKMINLKSVKDILRPMSGKCKFCGTILNPASFNLQFEKNNGFR